MQQGTFRTVDPVATGRAVLVATYKFHHPAHAAEWSDSAIDAVYNDVWQLLMDGLCVITEPQKERVCGEVSQAADSAGPEPRLEPPK